MSSTDLADADAALAAALKPLRDVMTAIESEITEREAALAALRKRRTETGRALAALDPRWAAEHKPQPKAKGPKRPLSDLIGPERLDELSEYLRTNFNDGRVFTARDVMKRDDWMGWHNSQLSAGLRLLQERGVLRLDSKGKGNRSFWAVTSKAK